METRVKRNGEMQNKRSRQPRLRLVSKIERKGVSYEIFVVDGVDDFFIRRNGEKLCQMSWRDVIVGAEYFETFDSIGI